MAAEVNKPDFSYVWAAGGAIVAPSDVKKQTGWTSEVPPFQWENFLQNRQDNAILHLFQKGISEWDAASNYYFTTSGVRSYVQGSDGNIYVAVADNVGQNPTTDTTDTYWKLAFSEAGRTGTAGGLGRRNILINAGGTINERAYVSGTATVTANQYTVDRWYVVTSGQSLGWTDAGSIRTFTAPAGGVTQAVRARNIEGGVYVLSYTGTATAQVNGVTVANGGTFTLPANSIARLKFSSGTFSNPQVELGVTPSSFDYPNDETERYICQKYYFRPVVVFTVAGNGSAGGNRISDALYFYPRMVGIPIATTSTGSGVNITIGALSVSDTALTQIATSGAAGYCSYLFTVTSLDAEFV